MLQSGYLNATCADNSATSGCTCTINNNDTDNSTSSYSVDGGTLTTGQRTFEFCVQGNDLAYREFGPNSQESGIVGTVTR